MIQKLKQELKLLTGHENVELCSRGNKAILSALHIAKETVIQNHKISKPYVLIPDQGGWLTYSKYCKMLGLIPQKISTDDALISIQRLPQLQNVCAILYTQPGGYFVDQPIKSIYDHCKGRCLVIMDASGSIGSSYCDGRYADIIIASFGKGKPMNIGYGGCITIKDQKIYKQGKEIFKTNEFDLDYTEKVIARIKDLPKRYQLFKNIVSKTKKDLSQFPIIHPKKHGIVVVIGFANNDQKNEILKYCDNNKLEYTICPREIRVTRSAVSIEIKRL